MDVKVLSFHGIRKVFVLQVGACAMLIFLSGTFISSCNTAKLIKTTTLEKSKEQQPDYTIIVFTDNNADTRNILLNKIRGISSWTEVNLAAQSCPLTEREEAVVKISLVSKDQLDRLLIALSKCPGIVKVNIYESRIL